MSIEQTKQFNEELQKLSEELHSEARAATEWFVSATEGCGEIIQDASHKYATKMIDYIKTYTIDVQVLHESVYGSGREEIHY